MCKVCEGTGILRTDLGYGVSVSGCMYCPPEVRDKRMKKNKEKNEALLAKWEADMRRRSA